MLLSIQQFKEASTYLITYDIVIVKFPSSTHYDRLSQIPPIYMQVCCMTEQLLYLLDLPRYLNVSIKTEYIQIKTISKTTHTTWVFLYLTT